MYAKFPFHTFASCFRLCSTKNSVGCEACRRGRFACKKIESNRIQKKILDCNRSEMNFLNTCIGSVLYFKKWKSGKASQGRSLAWSSEFAEGQFVYSAYVSKHDMCTSCFPTKTFFSLSLKQVYVHIITSLHKSAWNQLPFESSRGDFLRVLSSSAGRPGIASRSCCVRYCTASTFNMKSMFNPSSSGGNYTYDDEFKVEEYAESTNSYDFSVLAVALITLGLVLPVELVRHAIDHRTIHRPFAKTVLEFLYSECEFVQAIQFYCFPICCEIFSHPLSFSLMFLSYM